MEVLQTTNYQQFRMVMSNREVDEKHVKRLVKSISEKNLLNLNPIVVDEEMAVIDGQHRLEAAKELDLPVFYIVSGNIKKEDISRINSNAKNWSPMDYINYYTIEGNPKFQEVSRLICKYPLFSVSAILRLVSSAQSYVQDYKNGHLDVSNLTQANEILAFCNHLRNEGYEFAIQRNFVVAIRKCFNTEGFDGDDLLRKIDMMPRQFVPCIDVKQYLDMIEEIYNYRNSKNVIRLR